MTVWLEFPASKLSDMRRAYTGAQEGETIQESPMVDATGRRMIVGTSRMTPEQAQRLAEAHSWLIVHTEFPDDWEYAAD